MNVIVPVAANVLECEALRDSLIYRMSNGSHELFHSNVLAWILERDREFVKLFFPALPERHYEVRREWRHMDISILMGNDVYVIENKFKTLPGRYQLERYKKSVTDSGKTFRDGVILGVHDVLGGEYPDGWRYVDYDSVVGCLRQRLCADNFAEFEKLALAQYASLVERLKREINRNVDWVGNKMPAPDDYANLEKVQLKDLCKKIQTAVFAKRLSKELDEGKIDEFATGNEFNFSIDTSFLRGDAILNVRFYRDTRPESDQQKDDHWGAEFNLGIQIHANKFMWFIKPEQRRGQSLPPADLTAYFRDCDWFVDNSTLTTPTGRPQRENLYTFGGGFGYQYRPLISEGDYSYQNLFPDIKSRVDKMIELLPKLRDVIRAGDGKCL